MQQVLGALILGGSILAGLTTIVLPTIDERNELRAENERLEQEIDSLEQRYIDQLLRSQQND